MESMCDNFQYRKIKTPPKYWGDITDEDYYEELLPKPKPKASDEIKKPKKETNFIKFVKAYSNPNNSYFRL